ncbi:hypothetical protein C6P45_003317 [Maudiozyma exigua]|uniref:Uncharacterized protein n=1 Tax=Maudiozyma exigua TaxID=34358 RepID=A0A9P6WE31_MAUEX|nr:hypothetical protein C6P45_003317 [Kazachstania exigua]
MIQINTNIPYDFVTSVLHNTPNTHHSHRLSSNNNRTKRDTDYKTEMMEPIKAIQDQKTTTTTTTTTKTCRPRQKREKLFTTVDKLSNFLNNDSNKLIHLEPVPIFEDKSEIKPWLQKIFFPQGIDLVIERSDKSKIIFKCKAVTRSTTDIQDETTTTTPIITTNCPFRIRASYSLKLKKWNIVIVNNTHSHQCVFNPDSDEYKKFKNHLIATNDMGTIKEFEELEYKTKFKLPILPKVISCDCGLTSEVNWFDVVIPEPKISGTKKVTKKVCSNNNNNITTNNNSSSTLNTMNNTNIKKETLSNFLDLNNPSINLINSKNVTPPGNVTNLDEIDFTNMFASTNKPVPIFKKREPSKKSLFQNKLEHQSLDDSTVTSSLDDFNFNKIITTPSSGLNLTYPMDFNTLGDDFTNHDLNLMIGNNIENNGLMELESTAATTLDTLVEPADLSYMNYLSNEDLNLTYDLDSAIPNNMTHQVKREPDSFNFDTLM